MNKDANQRFQTMEELVEALVGVYRVLAGAGMSSYLPAQGPAAAPNAATMAAPMSQQLSAGLSAVGAAQSMPNMPTQQPSGSMPVHGSSGAMPHQGTLALDPNSASSAAVSSECVTN